MTPKPKENPKEERGTKSKTGKRGAATGTTRVKASGDQEQRVDRESAQARVEELRPLLRVANEAYYQKGESPMSDVQFDQLMHELEDLEEAYPELQHPDSPTHKVGSDLVSGFKKVSHRYPMLSIQNTYSEEEVRDFHRQVTEKISADTVEYVCEPKIDGVAMSLVYEDRCLVLGVTRGDGVQGDDVTRNIRTIKTIPQELHKEFPQGRIEVRGEIYMKEADFLAFNEYSMRVHGRELQNPRNTASGSLKLKDPKETAQRPLSFFAYNILSDSSEGTHWENLLLLDKSGFPVNSLRAKVKTVDEVMAVCEEWNKIRDGLPYLIDGVVIKVNSLKQQAQLGRTAKNPKWVIAYKYKAEAAETVLESVSFQVGRTGVVTPVANLKPVQLGGTLVKRATLHNFDEIERLDLRVPDVVMVEKGGEIIPKIISVVKEKRPKHTQAIIPPKVCPICGSGLSKVEEEVAWRCDNLQCPAQVQRAILHFASRGAMNIENVGPALVDLLLEKKVIENVADLYDLNREDLEQLERMAEKSADNVITSIAGSKERGLDRLLFGLGIRFVGKTTAGALARHFKNLETLRAATLEELEITPDVGERIAKSLHEYFQNPETQKLLEHLKRVGVKTDYEVPEGSQILAGQTWVITGTLPSWSRDEAREILEKAGAKVSESISKKTSVLLAGESAGSKLEKAKKLGVKIVSEEEAKSLIG
jgi:DNA ligase (NAD+)